MVQASRIVSFIHAKGGTGASLLATNLAVGFSLASKTPTLLIDLDLNAGGSLASLLSLEQEAENHHLGKLVQQAINVNTLEAQIIKHDKGDVHLLAAPPIKDWVSLRPEQIYELLLVGNALYRHIVIDVSQPRLNEIMSVCLDCSSAVVPVVIPDIVSLQTSSHLLQDLQANDFSLSKFEMVLNMADLSKDLPAEDIGGYYQDRLKRPLTLQIPYAPEDCIKSVNRGIPLFYKGKDEELRKSLTQMVRHFLKVQPIDVGEINVTYRAAMPTTAETPLHMPQISTSAEPVTALTTINTAISGWTFEKYRETRQHLHERLLQEVRLQDMELDNPDKREEAKRPLRKKLAEIMLTDKIEISSRKESVMLIEAILDEALGLGPLESFLKDPKVTEIMVNGPEQIYVEKDGKLSLSSQQFLSERQLRVVIDRIVSPLGRRIDESSPMVDARLPDGSRVNIIIPPLALNGATLTIRKFPEERLKAKHLVNFGTVNREMSEFLDGCVQARLNILICGGTGSGKTTLLNILSSFIPHGARVVTIEDAAELQLDQKHVIRLESRPANMEGKGQVSIRDLVKNSLRMRPDRIVVGEVRGGEALDMLQAMNTGHEGSLTTCHANAPREALARLETMVLMAGVDLPIRAIREQISSAVDLIVHQSRLRDGTRKVMHITEVSGMEGDTITLQDIFKYEQLSVDDQGNVIGRFVQSEIRPQVLERFTSYGIAIPTSFTEGGSRLEDALGTGGIFENDGTEKEQKKGFFW
jgi:pilus assembly protein CpaF